MNTKSFTLRSGALVVFIGLVLFPALSHAKLTEEEKAARRAAQVEKTSLQIDNTTRSIANFVNKYCLGFMDKWPEIATPWFCDIELPEVIPHAPTPMYPAIPI